MVHKMSRSSDSQPSVTTNKYRFSPPFIHRSVMCCKEVYGEDGDGERRMYDWGELKQDLALLWWPRIFWSCISSQSYTCLSTRTAWWNQGESVEELSQRQCQTWLWIWSHLQFWTDTRWNENSAAHVNTMQTCCLHTLQSWCATMITSRTCLHNFLSTR